ncbi:hypothetical protein DFH07DRAFT_995622 [Mycena maculata]|uniref:Protein kinase domain-containing protein n=1 Tax=Mycena maculata TaxID=230809 RepID=A0AAD7KDP0_9AGAR|nr:hypothetical protein DFH07DRAFT_995622 [Mycena maculata]
MSSLSLPFNWHRSTDRPLYAVAESTPSPRPQPSADALFFSERLSSRPDGASAFFKALFQRYPSPSATSILDVEKTPITVSPGLPVDWTRKELSPQRRKPSKPLPPKFRGDVLQKAIYTPHGKWAWTAGLPFRDSEPSVLLSSGVMCSVFLKTGKIGDRPVKYVSKVWPTKEKWHGFFSELALYKAQLKSLQGRVVPAIINVYSSTGAVSVAMEPPHPSFWLEASSDMPHVLKKRCVQAFEKLHEAGVYHGDVELRHMLIGADARVTLIDFQASRALVPNPAVHLAAASPDELRMEMRKVRFKLDYEGARAWEDAKLMRAARLARRNREGAGEEPLEEDQRDPPIDSREWNLEWIGAPVEPVRFVMPGQCEAELERAVDEFLATIEKLEVEGPREDGEGAARQRRSSPEFKPPNAVPARPMGSPTAGKGFGATVMRPTTRDLKRKGARDHDRPQEDYKRARIDVVPPPLRPTAPLKARDFAYEAAAGPSLLLHPPIKVRDFAYEAPVSPLAVSNPPASPASGQSKRASLPPPLCTSSPRKRKRPADADEGTETRARPRMRTVRPCDVSLPSRCQATAADRADEAMDVDECDPLPKSALATSLPHAKRQTKPKTATRTKHAAFDVRTPPPVLFRWIENLWRFVY